MLWCARIVQSIKQGSDWRFPLHNNTNITTTQVGLIAFGVAALLYLVTEELLVEVRQRRHTFNRYIPMIRVSRLLVEVSRRRKEEKTQSYIQSIHSNDTITSSLHKTQSTASRRPSRRSIHPSHTPPQKNTCQALIPLFSPPQKKQPPTAGARGRGAAQVVRRHDVFSRLHRLGPPRAVRARPGGGHVSARAGRAAGGGGRHGRRGRGWRWCQQVVATAAPGPGRERQSRDKRKVLFSPFIYI